MFKIFKRKPKHVHIWEKVDSYFDHILTEYANMGDSVLIYNLEKCALCKRERKVLIDERTYPVNNNESYNLKQQYLKLLKSNGIKSKEEYNIKKLKGV